MICVVFSPDTDVLLMLIYYYPQLCLKTVFKERKGKDIRKIDIEQAYQAITPRCASALLGFHAFTGHYVTLRENLMAYQNNIAGNNFLIAVGMNLKPFLILEIAKVYLLTLLYCLYNSL